LSSAINAGGQAINRPSLAATFIRLGIFPLEVRKKWLSSQTIAWALLPALPPVVILYPAVAVKSTPLVAQYLRIKQQVPDALLFFRLGDFYEMFFEDAEIGSRLLEIQLTSRSKDGVPLCGVPYHAAEGYIARLLRAGMKVAICEQCTPEGNTRGLMPRRIVRVITPGTVGEETVLVPGEKNFLVAIAPESEQGFGLAAVDVSTGEFIASVAHDGVALTEEISRLDSREIIASRSLQDGPCGLEQSGRMITWLDPERFDAVAARAKLENYFGASCAEMPAAAAAAAAAALTYLQETFGGNLDHLRPPSFYRSTAYMTVDETTRRHLELVVSTDGGRSGSLLAVLDETLTAVGARTLSNWLVYPLLDLNAIAERHNAVEEFFNSDLGGPASSALRRIGDLERLAGRIGSLRASPRDCQRLAGALTAVGELGASLAEFRSPLIRRLAASLRNLPNLVEIITATLSDDPPINLNDGNVIRAGFNAEVDELRALAGDARSVIARLERDERDRTGIASLKVRYNQVFGYYIEVTRPNLDRVPPDYERRQTLVNAERFTTPALRELERRILGAETGLKELERRLFASLAGTLARHAPEMLDTARAVGEIDALIALAKAARRRGYVRPSMNSGRALKIRDGRHPVLETAMAAGEFVPNDLDLDPDSRQLLLITGPNMAGKSTYLRQVALIVIMAHIGSFVPAREAEIGLTDRVFTRIGARDELRRGESTFMVEMRETARLISGLTERSLLLLDEVGRGTSTFDGLAIAWAVAEYLHDSTRARILFATHFHELTELARERPRGKNLSMAVREWGGEVIFLRQVVEGPASRSYGIEVARLAGLPDTLIARAREILADLERGELEESGPARLAQHPGEPSLQLALFASPRNRILEDLRTVDVDRLSPLEALNILAGFVARLRQASDE
jgi:DNA mismatch repair protein MutS